ncbi:spoIIIJ-associated protein [Oikeobacillus pervagus]|uniref:RNA-binding protein KhpB n=1 Tax=Oikeobacillus pervagus TaxID=1325931 RepID=A0AAJ1T3L8_9BACI|nr:RNA-binding cell elongation regulator Jag/EloR [Oikeobacillus pervagus]MDQ0216612.1 spoIIIJ-associated protein [Oikeobacillus pervagus]
MKEVTAKGQTVEEAIQSALDQLQTSKDHTEVVVIDKGKKGLLGLFGGRPAVVKVTLMPDPIDEVKRYLQHICEQWGLEVGIESSQNGKDVLFDLQSEKAALLIGKRGKTLNSLQLLSQMVANHYSDQYINIILDVENYRTRRRETLIHLSERIANQVVKAKKEIRLEPMPSFERKIVHSTLAHHDQVKTYSDGFEPYRSIVISPK